MATGLGIRIRNRRKELGLSQEGLAEKMGLKSKSTICKVERGDDNLTTTAVRKYADALDCVPGYLMGWTEYPHGDDLQQDKQINEEAESVDIDQALRLYELYRSARPDVQTVVETLLKLPKQDS